MLGHLGRLMPDIAPPTATEWREIGLGLMRGDAPMDALVAAMAAHGMPAARAQFERALAAGIAAVPSALPELRAFMEQVEHTPDWVDPERVARGATLYNRCGRTAIDIGRDVSFMGGYQASGFNRTLLLTGSLQKSPLRRFAETTQWFMDCTAEGGLRVRASGWRATLRVRLVHALIRRSVATRPDWRMGEWGLPINQTDMAATLYGATLVPVLGSRMLGVPQTRRERDDAAHLGRYVGWLIGVEDRWLADSENAAARQLLHLLLSLDNPDDTSPLMARPLAAEPLNRAYPNLAWLRGRVERARHLSLSRAFLGAAGMRKLGLPAHSLPWYPALLAATNLLHHGIYGCLPGGKAVAARRGRIAQQAWLRQMENRDVASSGISVRAAVHPGVQ